MSPADIRDHTQATDIATARSWLLVPADQRRRLAAAQDSAADAVVIDLEDGVAGLDKQRARHEVHTWLRSHRAWVRVNGVDDEDHWRDDLAALEGTPGLLGVVLAKTESVTHIVATARRLTPETPLVAMIESALGLHHSASIACAPSVRRLAFGVGDYRLDTGVGSDALALSHPRSMLTHHSRLAGIAGPIDGPSPAIDHADLDAAMSESIAMGMTARLTLKPEQVDHINRRLSPSTDDVAWADGVIARLGSNSSNIRDSSDRPDLERARRILDRAEIYRRRQVNAR